LLIGRAGLNTLADYRHTRVFRAKHGDRGGGCNCTGKSGADLILPVPLGTCVIDIDTEELIGDVTHENQMLLVAQGGKGGLGNTRFKSSTNRTPRRTTPGTPGEQRELRLELHVLADVGLLGLPNAGKSTLLRAVSQARPKVADYPFTTLYPHLGVVRVGPEQSFVIADIPGLIEGAAEGAGLGIQFLRHLARTRILLHLADVSSTGDTAADVKAIVTELKKFDSKLAQRERWLVLTKMDLIPEDERDERVDALVRTLSWSGPLFRISAITGDGCAELMGALMHRLEELKQEEDKHVPA